MSKFQIGDRVRILANLDVFAHEMEGAFRYFEAKELGDQFGTVIPGKTENNEVAVELDNSKTKIMIQQRFLVDVATTV